mmetsp:Transcript_14629/g.14259  ORF Transcript_14629/g.14259 Transcript_14629/m.14259 type:complete len:119 (+) Transcript_14629:982-1338(+)
MSKVCVKQLEEYYPHIVQQMRERIKSYTDSKMEFRRQMIRNLHYMCKLNDHIINELICCMEVKRFAKDQVILKSGDVSSKICFLRNGEISIYVSNKIGSNEVDREELLFDTLNTGSAF